MILKDLGGHIEVTSGTYLNGVTNSLWRDKIILISDLQIFSSAVFEKNVEVLSQSCRRQQGCRRWRCANY